MFKKIILASSSPRRKELLALAGIEFDVKVPDIDEALIPKEAPIEMVKRLSYEKAQEVWRNFLTAKDSAVILAADTTVVNSQKVILGKPRNQKEAVQMLESLQGKAHFVYTGYAILDVIKGELRKKVVKSIKTRVFIQKMNLKEIQAYVAKGESFDKAGGYAAQGFGMAIIEKIEGSYTNVVGLPISEVMADLRKMGWKI